jgi:hypothetical protein
MADDSISKLKQQREQELLKTTEQFSKKFKSVVRNMQEVNSPLAKTIADLRETTKGSYKAAVNAKELQNYTKQVVQATSDNADKTKKSYKKLAEGLDKLSGTSGFLDQLKIAQDNYGINQKRALILEQEIANAEIENRKEIQDYRDKIQKLELDQLRAEGLGQVEYGKKLEAEKKKQSLALTKFETEIYDTKREELEIQKDLMSKSKSNLEKLNETVEKQSKEIADQDTKFTMFGQGLKELTGLDLLGTLDGAVNKIDAVGKLFGSKDLSGSIMSSFGFGGNDDIVSSIAGDSQEVDPAIKIAKKELKETEEVNEGVATTNKLLRTLIIGGAINSSKSGDENTKNSLTYLPGLSKALLPLAGAITGYFGADKISKQLFDASKDGGKAAGKGAGKGAGFLSKLPKMPRLGGRGKLLGGLAGLGLGGAAYVSAGEDNNSEFSALSKGLDVYQNNKITDKVRPDELASESYESYSARSNYKDLLKDFDDQDPRKVDKLFNKDGKLDKRTKFWKDWKAENSNIYGKDKLNDPAELKKMLNISPSELDNMLNEGTKKFKKQKLAANFDRQVVKNLGAKLPFLGSGLDVFFDNREQNKYGKGIGGLESEGLLTGDMLKTAEGAQSANKRGSVGRGIGSWAGGLMGAAAPAAVAILAGSNPVGWAAIALSLIGGVGGAMLGGMGGDKLATFDGQAQELTATLASINGMDISNEEKESKIADALRKYKGIVDNNTQRDLTINTKGMDGTNNTAVNNTAMNTNVDNRSTTINNTRPLFRNPDDSARLVDVKYS